MGTHGRGGFERFILGSVAEKVLQEGTLPGTHCATAFGDRVASARAIQDDPLPDRFLAVFTERP